MTKKTKRTLGRMNETKYIDWEDFKPYNAEPFPQYVSTHILCPMCRKPILKNQSYMLLSIPPKYEYICINCGWKGIK